MSQPLRVEFYDVIAQQTARLRVLRAAKSKAALLAKYQRKKHSTIAGGLLRCNFPSDVGMITSISHSQISIGAACEKKKQEKSPIAG